MATVTKADGIMCPDCGSAIIKEEIAMHFVNGCTVDMWICDGCSEGFTDEQEATECCEDDEEEEE